MTQLPPCPPTSTIAMKVAPQAPKGLYLYGGKGCGKTILQDIFLRSLPEGTHINEALNVKEVCRALWSRGVTTLITPNCRQNDLYGAGFNREAFEVSIPDLAEPRELCASHQRGDPFADQSGAAETYGADWRGAEWLCRGELCLRDPRGAMEQEPLSVRCLGRRHQVLASWSLRTSSPARLAVHSSRP